MSTPQKLPPEESLPLVAEIWTCQGEIDACRDDGMLGAFDTDHTQGNAHFDIGYVRLETATARESALIAERDALRVVAIEQSALLGELSKGLFPDDDLFAQIVEVGAKLDALAAPAVEGA